MNDFQLPVLAHANRDGPDFFAIAPVVYGS
jgi:hypothetical protein